MHLQWLLSEFVKICPVFKHKLLPAFCLTAVGGQNVFTCLPGPRCCPWLQEVLLGSRGQTGQYCPWVWRRSQWASVVLAPWLNVCLRQRGLTEAHLWLERFPAVKQTVTVKNHSMEKIIWFPPMTLLSPGHFFVWIFHLRYCLLVLRLFSSI